MLNFVYTLQAIAIILTGIVSSILAKLELSFVNFKSIFNIKRSYMSGSHMTYCLQIDKIVVFLAISWSFLSIFPAQISLVVFMINTAVMRCVM